MNRSASLLIACVAFASSTVLAQPARLPIIDMHFHAIPVESQGPPPLGLCSPFRGMPVADTAIPYAEQWTALLKEPPCDDAIWSPTTEQGLMSASLDMLEKHNIIGVTSGPAELVRAYKQAAPERIVQGVLLSGSLVGESESINSLRALHAAGSLEVIGELTTQYVGISPDDERLEPLWALAVELDIPVGIHIGTGPPGVIYLGAAGYRARLHSALTLEEVLVRHPMLRVYIMHAGWPMIDDLLAVMYAHPQVYVDLAVIDWAIPTAEFYGYLRRIVDAGFGQRVMYGSDQMVWPGMIERSITAIQEAPFLSESQRRDIFYGNAARFLKLSDEAIARHHRM